MPDTMFTDNALPEHLDGPRAYFDKAMGKIYRKSARHKDAEAFSDLMHKQANDLETFFLQSTKQLAQNLIWYIEQLWANYKAYIKALTPMETEATFFTAGTHDHHAHFKMLPHPFGQNYTVKRKDNTPKILSVEYRCEGCS